MTKKYFFDGFIDCLVKDTNRILKSERIDFMCSFGSDSLRSALYEIDEKLTYEDDYIKTFIGIRQVICDGKQIDWNYKNRVIHKDEYLRERFWC